MGHSVTQVSLLLAGVTDQRRQWVFTRALVEIKAQQDP